MLKMIIKNTKNKIKCNPKTQDIEVTGETTEGESGDSTQLMASDRCTGLYKLIIIHFLDNVQQVIH